MSTWLIEKREKIEDLLAKLADKSTKGVPIVVEGQKDAEALRALGICGSVFMLKTGGKSFTDAVDEIERSGAVEVVLLLDFDRRGKRLLRTLKLV